jgi:urease accessory protein
VTAALPRRADLLLVLQHADGLFPSGSFAFSQGLEAVSALSDGCGPFDFDCFVRTQIRCRWAVGDRVALTRAHRAAPDLKKILALDKEVEASTIAEGFRVGSRRNGMGFLTAHERLSSPGAADYRAKVRKGLAEGHLAVVQGLIWRAIGLDEETAVAVSGYQMVAGLSTAATRLGLLGAIEAQATIGRALETIRQASTPPVADDEPLSSFMPITEIALALHGAAGHRLFSN